MRLLPAKVGTEVRNAGEVVKPMTEIIINMITISWRRLWLMRSLQRTQHSHTGSIFETILDYQVWPTSVILTVFVFSQRDVFQSWRPLFWPLMIQSLRGWLPDQLFTQYFRLWWEVSLKSLWCQRLCLFSASDGTAKPIMLLLLVGFYLGTERHNLNALGCYWNPGYE